MTDVDRQFGLAWAAGIVDGEGCISIYTPVHDGGNGWAIRLDVTNTDFRMIHRLKDIFGFGMLLTRQRPNRRLIHNWRVCSRQAAQVLAELEPFLVAKQEQARVALDLAATIEPRKGFKGSRSLSESTIARRHDLRQQLRVLKRGAA